MAKKPSKKPQYRWVRVESKPKISPGFKAEVQARGDEVVERVLKPRCLQPPPPNPQFNYIVDIYTKWHQSYFYFCARYAVSHPNAIEPFFEVKNARMKYTGGRNFSLAWMRHTGEWVEMETGLSLEECLKKIAIEDWYFTC
jgi:hypothetical protein